VAIVGSANASIPFSRHERAGPWIRCVLWEAMIAVGADRGVEPNLPTAIGTESEAKSRLPIILAGVAGRDVDDRRDEDPKQDDRPRIRTERGGRRPPVVGQDDTQSNDEEDHHHHGRGLALPLLLTALLRSCRRDGAHAYLPDTLTAAAPSSDILARDKVLSPSRWRRPDESVLHEEFRFLAGPSNQLEGSLIEGVSGLRLPRDSLFHRLEGHGSGLPRKHVDLIHRGHDVRLVEAFCLRDPSLAVVAVRLEREFPLLRVLVRGHLDILPVAADDPLRVDEDEMLRLRARRDEELRGPDVRRPGADERDGDIGHPLANDLERVGEGGHVDR